jgi:hypothetical protein
MYILSKKGALIHAAGADFRNKGLIFPGKSGAGKSTLARQFMKRHQWKLLSDDRMVVRGGYDRFQAYGTPWPGEAGVAENLNAPVSGIFFLKQDSTNQVRELTKKEAYEKILPVVSIPWYDKNVFPEIMGFCEDMVTHNPCYEFSFIPGDGAVDALERFVSEYL